MLFELVDTDPQLAAKQLERALSALQPDGVMLTPPHTENRQLARILIDRGIPFGRIGAKPVDDGINIYMDDAAAAAAATDHLLSLGHRRIAFISGSAEYAASDARLEGYHTALAKSGLRTDKQLVAHGDFSFASGVTAMERLLALPERPTAVIASNDEMAFAVLHVASAQGLIVPDDLSVISFDDTPGVRFSVPPLTAIRQPIADLAAMLCRELIDAANGESRVGNHILPFDLVLRKTTVAPPA
jgi:LacI family transcriptional regulator